MYIDSYNQNIEENFHVLTNFCQVIITADHINCEIFDVHGMQVQ